MSHLDATPLPKNHSAKSPSPKDQIVGTKSFHFKFMSSQSGTAKPHLDICQQIFSHLVTLTLPAENHSAKSPSSKNQIVRTKSFHFKFVSSQSGTAKGGMRKIKMEI